MRRIVTNTFMTLDGVAQAPGAPQEDTSGKFNLGGWSVNYWDDIMMQTMGDASQTKYDLLLGRRTYEIFAAHWPFLTDDPMAHKFNLANKYVASKTLKDPTWENTIVLSGDTVAEIKKLKAGKGDELQVHGSPDFIQTLLKHALVDEFNVWIFPLVIGKGKKLFADGTVPSTLKLKDHKVSGSGVIITKYVPAGEINTGSFGLEEINDLERKRREDNN